MDKKLMATVSFSVNSPHDISPFNEKMIDVKTKKPNVPKALFLRQPGHASINSAPVAFRPLLTESLAFSG
jgi:hypothetical protein